MYTGSRLVTSRPQRFRALILQQGPNPYVEVPAAVSAAWAHYAEKGRIRVHGRLQSAEIRGNLVPRAGGHWLFLHTGMRAAAGVGTGDRVELNLRATPWNEVTAPRDVKAALRKEGALAAFEAMRPSHRHELLRWVESADSPERRAQRLPGLVAQVLGKIERTRKGHPVPRLEPLWICPKCGHVFVKANQAHRCKRFKLDEPFARSEPHVRGLFDRLRELVEAVGPVHIQAYRDYVAFLVRVRFVGATPMKRWLDVGFWLARRIDSPRFRKVETLTPTDHVHILRVADEAELDDEVGGWVWEAYEVGEQRHLG